MFRGEQLRTGVSLEYGSIEETIAFNSWCRNRVMLLQAVKAMTMAPVEAARTEGGSEATLKAFRGFARDLWPELEEHEKAVMANQRALLANVADKPIRLGIAEGPGGTLSVSMD